MRYWYQKTGSGILLQVQGQPVLHDEPVLRKKGEEEQGARGGEEGGRGEQERI